MRFVAGSLLLMAAAPGVGKTMLTLAALRRLAVPTLYFAADTPADLLAAWLYAGQHGTPIDRNSPPPVLPWLAVVDRPALDLGDLRRELDAYAELRGDWPAVVVVDVVRSVYTGSDEMAAARETLDHCQAISRETGALVWALHHLTRGYDDGTDYPPLSALQGAVTKAADQVLTLSRQSEHTIRVHVVKSRFGPADATGRRHVPLAAWWSHADFGPADGSALQAVRRMPYRDD